MANAITLQFTDSQLHSFEQLLDEFNSTMARIEERQPERQERMARLSAEIDLLLSQSEEELKRLQENRGRERKMLWEK